MRAALAMHPDADAVFFLGDGLSDIDDVRLDFPSVAFFAVKGNCDFRSYALDSWVEKTEEIVLLGKKIVYTHGDLFDAKYGTRELETLAEKRNADIILFGHTHTPFCSYYSKDSGGYYLFNPGSASAGGASFGLITIEMDKEPLFSHGSIK